MMPHNVLLL